jgi:glycosyltransferase involved in cell wall biosynthesis
VVVPSRGEPLEVLERSLRGYLALEYPRVAVWLLDDAARPELADLCRRLGCRYFSRTDGRHAKAGNLNHALPHLHGDLLLVLDADVVPQRHFLTRPVGLFDDPRVALVQTPQSYMNPDPVSRNLGLERWLMPDEEVFYRWIFVVPVLLAALGRPRPFQVTPKETPLGRPAPALWLVLPLLLLGLQLVNLALLLPQSSRRCRWCGAAWLSAACWQPCGPVGIASSPMPWSGFGL